MRHISYAAALLLMLAPTLASAQSASPIGDPIQPVQYLVVPEVPQPNDQVHITIEGVGTFLGDATLTWQRDGKTVLTGIGARDYTFRVGGLGSHTTIHVTINSATQGVIEHTFTFSPSVVNMLWEADTTVPPLYKGKSLYTGGSTVTIAVFPEVMYKGAFVSSKSLSYQWTLNDDKYPEQSGVGRSTFVFKGDQLKQGEQVDVDVLLFNKKVAQGTIFVPAMSPKVLLYERDPLRGELLDRALSSQTSLTQKEVTVQAEPYFFSNTSKKNGALTYAWMLNDNDASGPDTKKGILTLRQTGTGGGSAILDVSAQNTEGSELIQAANTTIAILFGQQTNTSAFGI